MKIDIKQMLATPKGRLIFSLVLLACSWIFLFFYFFSDISTLMPGRSRIAAVKQEIARLSPAYEKAVAERADADKIRDQYRKMVRSAWIEARDGMVESGLRNQLNIAAQAAEAVFNNLGAVKVSRVNSEFYLAELDVSLSGTYEGMIRFLEEVEKLRPRVCWRRLDIRPDPGSRRNANTSLNLAASVNGIDVETETRVNINGAVRVVGYDGKIPSDIKFTPRDPESAAAAEHRKIATAETAPAAGTPPNGEAAPPPPPDGGELPPPPMFEGMP